MKISPRRNNLEKEEREKEVKRQKVIRGELPSEEEKVNNLNTVTSALLGGDKAQEVTAARQIRHALTMFANTLPVDKALEVVAVYPEWETSVAYEKDQYVRHGMNADKEPQLYRVISPHVSQSDWTPDKAVSLFVKVGFTETGTPVWIQPMGSADSYSKGDVVSFNNTLYTSDVDGNVWQPGVYGWTKKTTTTGAKK